MRTVPTGVGRRKLARVVIRSSSQVIKDLTPRSQRVLDIGILQTGLLKALYAYGDPGIGAIKPGIVNQMAECQKCICKSLVGFQL
ncbi:hypothetical protein NC651_014248 [Populus alba x Populus x berolinensis]|nr:hypothetical protein NC651_014248 [Populus alba x Populus x berolinensis]